VGPYSRKASAGSWCPRGIPGFTSRDIRQKLSLRASVTSELAFDSVRLPDSARLPLAEGLRAPLSCLSEARFGIVFGAIGRGPRLCVETALAYAAEADPVRPPGGRVPAHPAENWPT